MYPTIIIILVALKSSHLEHQFTSYGSDADTPAQFGSGRTIAAHFIKSASGSDTEVGSTGIEIRTEVEKAEL